MKGDKGKAPAVQWYYKDWLSDRELQLASPASRGIWMNLLMYLIDCSLDGKDCHDGVLEDMTINKIMRLGSCSEDEAWGFIEDALAHAFCDVQLDKNRTFHIMSRRLSKDIAQRRKWREDKQKQRSNDGVRNDVHQDVRECSTPSPPLSPIPTPIPNNKYCALFAQFWDAYPLRKDKKRAYKSWKKIKDPKTILPIILEAIKKQSAEKDYLRSIKQFCPEWKHPSTWLNGECWDDEVKTAPATKTPKETREVEYAD